MNQNKAAIILAAGMGTRMKSDIPKVMHKVAGQPMVNHVINACENASIDNITVIVGPDMNSLIDSVSPHKTIVQHDRNGTGGAAKIARQNLDNFNDSIFILNGDGPFIMPDTLNKLEHASQKTGLAVLGCEFDNPHGYGRFITDGEYVHAIVEEKDCTDDQRQIRLANTGVYCVSGKHLFNWLDKVTNNNAQSEYYLTDIIAIAAQEGVQCAYTTAEEYEVMGINDRVQLAQAEKIMQSQLRDKAMKNGVTMIDPETVYLSVDIQFGRDVIVEPNVVFGKNVRVGDNTHIHAFSHIEGAIIGDNASIGPFARIRPKSKIGNNVNVGNFIEVNRSEFKDGSKSKHLSYIGDAVIGEKTNIGAGTVFANYDGFNKHVSTTGHGVFIGSNSTIVSPVNIDDGAMVAAGSTVTQDVEQDALAVGRAKERILSKWAKKYRDRNKK
jgi:bifunctional UDP-N-acetylglucosamine pyrophosphorylase/glucosamine-1-phosphate N-acetyltransferase